MVPFSSFTSVSQSVPIILEPRSDSLDIESRTSHDHDPKGRSS